WGELTTPIQVTQGTPVTHVTRRVDPQNPWSAPTHPDFAGALVLGGTQALSRSLFSHLVPRGQEAEWFGLYEVSDKGTSAVGSLLFGLTLQLTGSYRSAILSLLVFFVLGGVLLARVDVARGAREAGNQAPARV
ncbi:MAG: MFS transporter, partial [Actinomycetota bacterium]